MLRTTKSIRHKSARKHRSCHVMVQMGLWHFKARHATGTTAGGLARLQLAAPNPSAKRQTAPSSVLAPSSDALVTSSFFLLVVRPGAPSSVLAPSSDALVTSSFFLLVVRPGAPSSVLAPSSDALVVSSFFLLVVRPGAPSSVLAPSSDALAASFS